MLKIYNTLFRKIEEFKPLNPPKVGMYICGPTVYDYAHLGHARTYTNSDVLVRTLRWFGYQVKVVMNITDVGHLTSQADTGEDKVEKKARLENKTAQEIAKYYTDDFWQMCVGLNILKPDIITPATQHIPTMINLIKTLEQKGFVYKTDDGIYFDTSKLADYGRLGRIDIKGLQVGWRVEKRQKKHPTDFALWKFSPSPSADGSGQAQRQMEWESPWGIGFPGWHIECSAMSMKYLGETLDIHTGGVDHIPVHHTNEIAQSEAATGKQFVRYWFHSNFLDIDGAKMSKSLGNFYRVKDLIDKGYEPLALRYLFLTGHYRTKMNFTWKALDGAQEAYKKLKALISEWVDEPKVNFDNKFNNQFKTAIENDLNLPQALAVVWEMVKSPIASGNKLALIQEWDKVLGLNLGQKGIRAKGQKMSEEIKKLINLREKLRQEKKWQEADELRKQNEAQGHQVKDEKIKA
ncbi:MAG: cysteine--tRNA ligase [Candidatus Beckwithbacteria bacterium]|nr:cysteine--tRNA ligase [Candidatus Beckwithbacteria bacterium]